MWCGGEKSTLHVNFQGLYSVLWHCVLYEAASRLGGRLVASPADMWMSLKLTNCRRLILTAEFGQNR